MKSNVISLNEHKFSKYYQNGSTANIIDFSKDEVTRKDIEERDIRKEMITGYMKLLNK